MNIRDLIDRLIEIQNLFDDDAKLEITLMQEVQLKNGHKETLQVESSLKDIALVTSYKKGKPLGGSRVVIIGNEID